jgi:16S rRNA (uracil1498-N3)-methyltransferase
MHRFFVPSLDPGDEQMPLPDEVRHHLGVLRAKAGEEILLLDGAGTLCRCRLETVGRAGAQARILARWQEKETAFPIHLFQALPKGEKMELILQKGTELGIRAFTPVLAGRSVPTREKARADNRLQRWHRIVREAARQCRRPLLPQLAAPHPLPQALELCEEELRLLLWEEESRPLAEILPAEPPRSAAVLVGPEGGFDREEVDAARRAGFIPVRFGPRILRSETAGFAVAAVLQYQYGDLGPRREETAPVTPSP